MEIKLFQKTKRKDADEDVGDDIVPVFHSWKWDMRQITQTMLYSTLQTKQCLTDLMLQQFDSIECLFGV